MRWIKRIEEIKGRFDENFRKYLKNEGTGFGTIRLKLSAAAIQRPALADKPPSQEPFGVAELFRECGRSARDFQDSPQSLTKPAAKRHRRIDRPDCDAGVIGRSADRIPTAAGRQP